MAVKTTDMVKITPVDVDGEGKGMDVYVTAAELATGGSGFTQMAFIADAPEPFASLTTAAEAYNALLAGLIAAGIMAAS